MSQAPDEKRLEPTSFANSKVTKSNKAYASNDPAADAQAALTKGDLRLLGFAQRLTIIPGIEPNNRQAAIDACGVRLMKGFGDVIRSDDELSAMQVAHEYAKRYNAVIIERCLVK